MSLAAKAVPISHGNDQYPWLDSQCSVPRSDTFFSTLQETQFSNKEKAGLMVRIVNLL